jgi:hypothetical protein
MEKKPIKVVRLEFRDVVGAGKEVFAQIDHEDSINCGEFHLKGKAAQPIMQTVGYAPWIQFPPKEWRDMIEEVFTQMVDAWNEKYAIE